MGSEFPLMNIFLLGCPERFPGIPCTSLLGVSSLWTAPLLAALVPDATTPEEGQAWTHMSLKCP